MYAFGGCTSLEKMTIGKQVAEIGEYALPTQDTFTVYGFSGSSAQRYCQEYNIRFVALNDLQAVFTGVISAVQKADADGKIFRPEDMEEEGINYFYYRVGADGNIPISDEEWPLTITDDITIWVENDLKIYSIIYELDGGINSPENPETYSSRNPRIVLQDPQKDGYTFLGWFTAPEGGEEITSDTELSGNITLYARWQENKISITECTVTLSENTYVYDGKEKTPSVTVSYGDERLEPGFDYVVYYTENVNPGTAVVDITAQPESRFTGNVQVTFTIKPTLPENPTKIEPNAFSNCANLVNLNIKGTITEIGENAFADCKNLQNIYFFGNCPAFGKNVFGNVTATAYYPYTDRTWTLEKLQGYGGTITWIPWNPETGEQKKRDLSICEISVESKNYKYDGKAKTPSVSVKDGSYELKKDRDYTVLYENNINAGNASLKITGTGSYGGTYSAGFSIAKTGNSIKADDIVESFSTKSQTAKLNVRVNGKAPLKYTSSTKYVKVDTKGKVTIAAKYAGVATITIKSSETGNYLAASRKVTVTVNPAGTTISKCTNVKGKKAQIQWKKGSSVTGYQIEYSTDKNFKKGVTRKTISKSSTVKYTASKLTNKKTYYVRIRTYKKDRKATVYSSWSKSKSVKITK